MDKKTRKRSFCAAQAVMDGFHGKGFLSLTGERKFFMIRDLKYMVCYNLEDVTQKHPVFELYLKGAAVYPVSEDATGMSFVIVTRKKRGKQAGEFVFEAHDRQSLEGWIAAIKQCKGVTDGADDEPPGRVFGVTLADSVKRGAYENLPTPIVDCVRYLLQEAQQEMGLFRIAGSSSGIKELKQRYEDDLPVLHTAIHDCSGTLKLFLREMQEPVIPHSHYLGFLSMEATARDPGEKFQLYKAMLMSLPPLNKALMQFLLSFLYIISTHSEVNMMAPKNLGIVFAPNLLRPEVETAQTMLVDGPVTIQIMSFLIDRYVDLFQGEEEVVPIPKSELPKDMTEKPEQSQDTVAKMNKRMFGVMNVQRKGHWKQKHVTVSREDRCLRMFSLKDKAWKKPQLVLSLEGAMVSPCDDLGAEVFAFKIVPPMNPDGKVVASAFPSHSPALARKASSDVHPTALVLAASSAEEFERWMAGLLSIIWQKEGEGDSAISKVEADNQEAERKFKKRASLFEKTKSSIAGAYFSLYTGSEWVQRYVVAFLETHTLDIFRDEAGFYKKDKDVVHVDLFGAKVESLAFDTYNRPDVFVVRPAASNDVYTLCGEDEITVKRWQNALQMMAGTRRKFSTVLDDALMEGSAHVKMKRIGGWQQDRWLALSSDKQLHIYKRKHDKKPEKTLDLTGCIEDKDKDKENKTGEDDAVNLKLPFPFRIAQGKSKYQFCALTDIDRSEWLTAMTKGIMPTSMRALRVLRARNAFQARIDVMRCANNNCQEPKLDGKLYCTAHDTVPGSKPPPRPLIKASASRALHKSAHKQPSDPSDPTASPSTYPTTSSSKKVLCSTCGKKSGLRKFCTLCGAPLSSSSEPPSSTRKPPPRTSPSSSPSTSHKSSKQKPKKTKAVLSGNVEPPKKANAGHLESETKTHQTSKSVSELKSTFEEVVYTDKHKATHKATKSSSTSLKSSLKPSLKASLKASPKSSPKSSVKKVSKKGASYTASTVASRAASSTSSKSRPCTNCGTASTGRKFCTKCGHKTSGTSSGKSKKASNDTDKGPSQTCPKCANPRIPGKAFCPDCGHAFGDKCTSCGTARRPGKLFCVDCGAKF